jgi:hypothetical protein
MAEKPIILGCGFGRTGTMTMYTALKELGYHCHHMVEVIQTPKQRTFWLKLRTLSPMQRLTDPINGWDALFGDDADPELGGPYNAAVDFPCCSYVNELIDYFRSRGKPVKVILTTRTTSEKWFESCEASIFQHVYYMNTIPFRCFAPEAFRNGAGAIVCDSVGADVSDKQRCIEFYDRHNAYCREHLAKTADEFLDWDYSKHNYDDLMKFCEVEVEKLKGVALPKINSREEWESKVRMTKITHAVGWMVIGLGTVGASYLVSRFVKIGDKSVGDHVKALVGA